MFACPNCGGNLKFDISSQTLLCDFCQTTADPYSFEDASEDSFQKESFEATVFTCPQCGGEIISTDNSAAEFCSFCGASTILHNRLVKEKRPAYIIPFKKTKEDCKKAYSAFMRKAIFAPNALKNPKFIDGFRGIYMPYWTYDIRQNSNFHLDGEKSKRKGDYIYTDHFDLEGTIDAQYNGLSYDASSSFDDNISGQIAPYTVKDMKEFTPAYLSGFYADTADVPSTVYEDEALSTSYNHSFRLMYSRPEFKKFHVNKKKPRQPFDNTLTGTSSAMFPVWFMSYRNQDRVMYATVNGQTGKIMADLPVDYKKYLIGSIILALPIYLFLTAFFTVIPKTLLAISIILQGICNVLYTIEMAKILKKEGNLSNSNEEEHNGQNINRSQKRPKRSTNSSISDNVRKIILVFVVFSIFGPIFRILGKLGIWLIAIAVAIISTRMLRIYKKKLGFHHKKSSTTLSMISMSLGCLVGIFRPVSDLYYYAAVLFIMIATIFIIKDLIFYYNILSTRKLPQFNRNGGDDRA